MIRIGKAVAALALLLACSTALALVESTLDRTRVALGDTLRLTVSATEDDEDLGSIDLEALQRDFEVLKRSTRSNTSFVNGERSHNRQMIIDITPRRTGSLEVPAFQVGTGRTRPIEVEVSEPVPIDPGAAQILFDAELDRDSVYVQGQVILTVRLQQAVNLDNRSISELELPGTFVVPMEQKSFQRTANGRPWLVHEVRYAIFPEQSGTLQVPSLAFSAREGRPRRSLFDSGTGKRIRMMTEPLSIEVLPRPAAYPAGATWLPARELSVEEEWSTDPAKLQAGSSVTRTLRLRGEGLQGAQLPPITMADMPGLKTYPDQPDIQDAEIASGILGTRVDSTAIVPTMAGTVTLPEVRVPWWDTEAEEVRYATLPARKLQVAQAQAEQFGSAPTGGAATVPTLAAEPAANKVLPWQIATAVCAIGWLATFALWRRRRSGPAPVKQQEAVSPSRREAFKSLLAACAADQPSQARHWLIRWADARAGNVGITSLQGAAALFDDAALRAEVEQLEACLYSGPQGEWEGRKLAALIKNLDANWRQAAGSEKELPALYPAAG